MSEYVQYDMAIMVRLEQPEDRDHIQQTITDASLRLLIDLHDHQPGVFITGPTKKLTLEE